MRVLKDDEHVVSCHQCRSRLLYSSGDVKVESFIRPEYYGRGRDAVVTYEFVVCPECGHERNIDIKFKEKR